MVVIAGELKTRSGMSAVQEQKEEKQIKPDEWEANLSTLTELQDEL